jgi:hypothetical protein
MTQQQHTAALIAAAAAGAFFYFRGYRVVFKDGVVLAIGPELTRVLPAIEKAHIDAKVGRGAVITSANDGEHKAGSLHYAGKALDLRTKDFTSAQVNALRDALRKRLNGDAAKDRPYQVIIETAPAHIHLEYDPR